MRRLGLGCCAIFVGSLACGGPGQPPPDKDPVDPVVEPDAPVDPDGIPADAAPFLGELAVASVEEEGDRRVFALATAKLSDVKEAWAGKVHVMVSDPARWIGARLDDGNVRLAAAEVRDGEVSVSVYDRVPGLDLPVGNCGGAEIAVTAVWPAGGLVETCAVIGGNGQPVGPFRVRRDDTTVLEGTFSVEGHKVGPWVLRSGDGFALAEGVYKEDQPDGPWRFLYGGEQHEVPYTQGQQDVVPFAHLPIAHASPRAISSAAIDILDANLETGLVAARMTYTLDPTAAGSPVACPLLGRIDATGGMAMLLLEAGKRHPIGQWEVYRAVTDAQACPTEDEAAAALAEANAVYALHGLASGKRASTVVPQGEDLFDGLVLDLGKQKVTTVGFDEPMSLEAQLRSPDLVPGVWRTQPGQVVRSASILVDGRPVDEMWLRHPDGCDPRATVVTGIRQGAFVGLVYAVSACDGGGPLWAVGVPIRL